MPVALIRLALLAILFIASGCSGVRAETLQPVPALTARVLDQTGTLSTSQLQALEQQLAARQGAMTPERWQQYREEVLGQFRRDFFAQTQDQP